MKTAALTLLFVASIINSVGGLETADPSQRGGVAKGGTDGGGGGTSANFKFPVQLLAYITPLGIAVMLLYCTASGLAAVYSEFVLKRRPAESMFSQGECEWCNVRDVVYPMHPI